MKETTNINQKGKNVKIAADIKNLKDAMKKNNLSKGFPFINWSFRVGGLEKIGFLKPYVTSVSLEHAFSGKQNLSWKFNEEGILSLIHI